MLTLRRNTDTGKVAHFLRGVPKENIQYQISADRIPIYAQRSKIESDVIPRQNFNAYIDLDCFVPYGKNVPIPQQEIEVVLRSINHGKPLPPKLRYLEPIRQKAMESFFRNAQLSFNAEMEGGCFVPCPSGRTNQRDCVVIAGASGAGKTFLAGQYAEEFHRMYPDFPIYLFSTKPEERDVVFGKRKYITRVPKSEWENVMDLDRLQTVKENKDKPEQIKKDDRKERRDEREKIKRMRLSLFEGLDDEVVTTDNNNNNNNNNDNEAENTSIEDANTTNITNSDVAVASNNINNSTSIKQNNIIKLRYPNKKPAVNKFENMSFSNCLIILDDFETMSKEIQKLVDGFRNYVIQVGRESFVNVVMCVHTLMNGSKTSTTLTEATAIAIFPQGGGMTNYHKERFLGDYMGFSAAQIKEVSKCTNRWVWINKFVPMTILTQENLYIFE